ncbi:MAG: mandelate racemase/muconate lactonizing enzyme family protein [Chloroflexota bacterium]
MKITSVDIYDVQAKWRRSWNPIIIRINTDEGISGLGECGLAVGGGHNAYTNVVKDFAEAFLIGADPMNGEKIWETIKRRTWWGAGSGIIFASGISAIDIALWDIKGKAAGLPVYHLLGGKTNERIRTYASQVHSGWPVPPPTPPIAPEEFARQALNAVAEGFDAVKVDPINVDDKGVRAGWDLTKKARNDTLKLIYGRVAAIRKAVGPNVDIILETHAHQEVTTAIQVGRAMEDLNCLYYEEPVPSLNVDEMLKVAQNVKIPIAAGEHIYTRWGFRQYFEKQALEVIQPDLCVTGGITEGKKICDMAHTYGITVQIHCCGSPVTIAAALHVEAVIPNFIIHEHISQAQVKENLELCTPEIRAVNGYYDIPDRPGLGIELNDKVVNEYPHIKVS